MDIRLGRLPSPPHKRAQAFQLTKYLPRLPAGPSTLQLSPLVSTWPMYANDSLGDCTCAAAGHMLEVWTEQIDGKPLILTDQDIITMYETQGYNPANPATDQGANMIDVLNTWRKVGLANDKILAFINVDVSDQTLVQTACWLFSGVYIGVNLPITAQNQAVWDYVGGIDSEPGSWGGHCINVVDFDANGVVVVTWGELKRVTWAFWRAYVDEAYVVLPSEYDRLTGLLANGFNEDQLKADLAELANPSPAPLPPPIPVPPVPDPIPPVPDPFPPFPPPLPPPSPSPTPCWDWLVLLWQRFLKWLLGVF